ncbi:lipase [Ferrimonas balearica]|uniref:VolA/Pla-1 family phospholipase n=1 Tax=Ferrimonas balearica TaxID=44012 RepID=UPI001C59F558|nr:VolA/Pla-1 family phospholipase [Ferrimonas balearica]MBW3140283.1 lipase [Ferrimonas balearica]MBY6106608.1 lipase [Ferrimonas balearica]
MKRLLLSAAVASALGLVGCSGDSYQETIENTPTPVPFSRIAFDPGAGDIALPNDLLFSGTFDGTLEIPGEAESGDYTDPQIALGALDGWSTTMPMSITMIPGEEGISLDAASAAAAGSVRVFEVTLGGPLSVDPECTEAPSLSICKVGEELVFGEDFISVPSGNTINMVPLKPLEPASSYAVITTTQISDSEGQSVAPSTTYELLKLDINEEPLVTPEQLLLQGLVNNYENALAQAHSVDKATITYTGVFTTQSVTDVVSTVGLVMADGLNPQGPSVPVSPLYAPEWVTLPFDTGLTAADALGLTPDMGDAYLAATLAKVFQAEIALPYYLPNPQPVFDDNQNIIDFDINGRFSALGDSPVAVLQAVQGGLLSQESFATQAMAQGIDPNEALVDPSVLVGASFVTDAGEPVDTARHLTRFNPLPSPLRDAAVAPGSHKVTVPVLITIPDEEALLALSGGLLTKPENGWPVTVAMHGLGGVKELNLAYAGMYASKGIATVSIDMPLHGDRSFDLNGDGIYEVSATPADFCAALGDETDPGRQMCEMAYANGNPLAFVNLKSILTVRDNFRQAIADQLALRAALNAWPLFTQNPTVPALDTRRVSLQGLSLGGIVGTSTTAYTGLMDDLFGAEQSPYHISAASLVAPAGGLAGVFAGSATFGPVLKTALALEIAPDCVLENFAGPTCAAVEKQIESEVIPAFAFAAQTASDSMDPINHAAIIANSDVPVHLIEVVGDMAEGGSNPPDLVLPNTVEGFALSGTEPLIAALGLPAVTETVSDAAGRVSGAVRFSKGQHSSLIDPSTGGVPGVDPSIAPLVTVEMQNQVATFALTDGRTIPVGNGCLIQGGECAQ